MIRTLTFAALAFGLAAPARAQDSHSISLGDEYFIMRAYSDGMAEVAVSKLAAEKATEPGIKEFAEKMVKHHSECNRKLAEVAGIKAIILPKGPDAVHATATARLAKLSGSDFDKAYLMAQIGAHEDAIQLYGREAFKGRDDEVKDLAHEAMPELWSHVKMAFELAGEKEEYEKFHKIHEYAKGLMKVK